MSSNEETLSSQSFAAAESRYHRVVKDAADSTQHVRQRQTADETIEVRRRSAKIRELMYSDELQVSSRGLMCNEDEGFTAYRQKDSIRTRTVMRMMITMRQFRRSRAAF